VNEKSNDGAVGCSVLGLGDRERQGIFLYDRTKRAMDRSSRHLLVGPSDEENLPRAAAKADANHGRRVFGPPMS